jgi:hypothetical protein
MTPHAKALIDVGSVGTVVATCLGWLPHVAAILTIVWTSIRIIETDTAKRFLRWVRGR